MKILHDKHCVPWRCQKNYCYNPRRRSVKGFPFLFLLHCHVCSWRFPFCAARRTVRSAVCFLLGAPTSLASQQLFPAGNNLIPAGTRLLNQGEKSSLPDFWPTGGRTNMSVHRVANPSERKNAPSFVKKCPKWGFYYIGTSEKMPDTQKWGIFTMFYCIFINIVQRCCTCAQKPTRCVCPWLELPQPVVHTSTHISVPLHPTIHDWQKTGLPLSALWKGVPKVHFKPLLRFL